MAMISVLLASLLVNQMMDKKQEDREKHVREVDGKISVVYGDLRKRHLVLEHFVHLLRHVYHDPDGDKHKKHHKESGEIALQDVPVYYFHALRN